MYSKVYGFIMVYCKYSNVNIQLDTKMYMCIWIMCNGYIFSEIIIIFQALKKKSL